MIKLFLSTDGKHTVHVSAEAPEGMAELLPIAKAVYEKVLEDYGTKAAMWQTAINGQSNGQSKSSVPAVKRIDTVQQAHKAVTPHCPMHHKPMGGVIVQFGSSARAPAARGISLPLPVPPPNEQEVSQLWTGM